MPFPASSSCLSSTACDSFLRFQRESLQSLFPPSLCLLLCCLVSLSLSPVRTLVTTFRAHPKSPGYAPHHRSLNRPTSGSLLPCKSQSQVLRIRTWTSFRAISQPTTEPRLITVQQPFLTTHTPPVFRIVCCLLLNCFPKCTDSSAKLLICNTHCLTFAALLHCASSLQVK